MLQQLRSITWDQIFENWRTRESQNPEWISCAKDKGWPDWESWRKYTASLLQLENRIWNIYRVTDPSIDIPQMILGPYNGWQSRVVNKNRTTFQNLLADSEQFSYFSTYEPIQKMISTLPFSTEFIGFINEDTKKIICIDGHHRATSITLAKLNQCKIDYTPVNISIAIAQIQNNELNLLDEVLALGTTNPHFSYTHL